MSRSIGVAGIALLLLAAVGCGSTQSSGSGSVAAVVNGHGIAMSGYSTQVVYKRITAANSSGVDPCAAKSLAATCKQLKQSVLNDLIRAELIREYASSHHVVVTDAQFNRVWSGIFQQKFHSDAAVLKAYTKTLGLTPADLKGMERQNLLQQAVMYRVTRTMPANAPSVRLSRIFLTTSAQVRAVQRKLKQGVKFDALASALNGVKTSLCSHQFCGELGWIPYAFVPSQERPIIKEKDGTVAGPFSGQSGYSLLLVEGHDAHHPLSAAQQLALRQQVFAQWVNRQLQHSTVRRYVAT